MRVLIRADASTAIGTGHVVRCLSLAAELRNYGAEVSFVIRRLDVAVADRVRAAGYRVAELGVPSAAVVINDAVPHAAWAGVPWDLDAEETVKEVRRTGADLIVVDHYAFDARWHREIRGAGVAGVVVIDDLADRTIDADVIVDHNYATDHAQKYAGRLKQDSRLLGGPQYALLGPSYRRARRYVPRERVGSIGIFMGGADRGNYTRIALQACVERVGFTGQIEIATTAANPHLFALREIASVSPRVKMLVDEPDLSGFFSRHDLQIGAGGGANWERCCIGAPTVTMVVAENQRQVLVALRSLGVCHVVDGDPSDLEAVTRSVRHCLDAPQERAEMSARARALVDGEGASRVANVMMGYDRARPG